MCVKDNIFASKSERSKYYKLTNTWKDKCHIYHNIPFLNLFNLSELLKKQSLSKIDTSRLKKTSIDFVVCDLQDIPLIGIDFDGLQEGFNIGEEYYSTQADNAWRKIIMNLKLKVAHTASFPYVILGSTYFTNLREKLQISIVDGIIGEVLASKSFHEKMKEPFDPHEFGLTEEDFDCLDSETQYELVQTSCARLEDQAHIENNPIWTLSAELLEAIPPPKSWGTEGLSPPHSELAYPKWFGIKGLVTSEKWGHAEAEIWMPNFKSPGLYIGSLVRDIALLLALHKLKTRITERSRRKVSEEIKNA